MKKLIFSIIIMLLCYGVLPAQELTFEYNFGYGKFCMKDSRNFLAGVNPLTNGRELENMKITDNFPGNWIHQMKLGVVLKRSHNIGVSIDFMNTAGQKALSDYSGSYSFTYRTSGQRLGLFYRISPHSWFPGAVQPYFMLTGGVVLNDNRMVESFVAFEESVLDEKMSMKGIGSFLEPALGCKIRLHNNFALNLSVGYHVDLKNLYESEIRYISNNYYGMPYWGGEAYGKWPTWGGLRFLGGVVFYMPLRK